MWESGPWCGHPILVGGNLGEIGFTLAGTAVGGVAPLNARQLLLVNLLTDMAALAIALESPTTARRTLHARWAGCLPRWRSPATSQFVAGATAAGATGAWAVASSPGRRPAPERSASPPSSAPNLDRRSSPAGRAHWCWELPSSAWVPS